MSQRERKSKDEPGRALPNLPKFLQGNAPPPAKPAPAEPPSAAAPPATKPPATKSPKIAPEKQEAPSPQPPKAPAAPQRSEQASAPASKPVQKAVPASPIPKPDAPATAAPAPAAAKPVPPKPAAPTPVAPAPPAPAKASEKAPPETPSRPKEVSAETPKPAAKPSEKPAPPAPAAKQSESPRPVAAQLASAVAPAIVAPLTVAALQASSPTAPASAPEPEALEHRSEAAPSPVSDAADPGVERNGKNGFAVDDVLPQAVSFTILREAMAAEKQFRPILFAGPLKRVAKTPRHEAPTAAVVANRFSAPTLPEAKAAPERAPLEPSAPAATSPIAPAESEDVVPSVVAREEDAKPDLAAPLVRDAVLPAPAEAAEPRERETPEPEANDPESVAEAETSSKDRDRLEARRRKQVSSILAAAASRAKAASASEAGESESFSTFADPWEHLRSTGTVAPQAAGPTIRAEHEEIDETITPDKIVRRTPPFAISLGVHIVAFLLLALFAIPVSLDRTAPVELDLNYATEESGLMETLSLDLPTELEVSSGVEGTASDPFSGDLTEFIEPLTGPAELPGGLQSFEPTAPTGGGGGGTSVGFSGRGGGNKAALLGAFGGTVATQDAVKLGLGWMKRQQQPDGTWSMAGPYTNAALQPNTTAATAMALLCFFGDGHTPEEGEFRQTVTKGVDALLRSQNSDGAFYAGSEGWHQIYSQAQATIALCELYGMTGDERYRGPAERAVRYCVSTQGADGGWPHYPGQDSDTSVTGWYLMALKSGEMAGIASPPETFERVAKFLDGVQDELGRRYKRRALDKDYTKFMTAEAVLCREYLGWEKDDPRLIDAVDYLLESPPSREESEAYYWYCASQVMHHYGGEEWEAWNDRLRVVLPAMQEKKGPEQGSWNPFYDEWGARGGRLYMTALCLYTLEIYYRHLPLYQQAEKSTPVSTNGR